MLPHECPHPYHQRQARRRVERSGLAILLLSLLLSFAAGRWSLKNVDEYQRENATLREAVEQLSGNNQQLLKQQDMIQGAQRIDLQAKQESRRSLTKLYDELGALKEQLAFYQRVVAPETLVKGLYINGFKLTALAKTGVYRYQLVLAQGASQKRFLKGRYNMIISGELNGKTKQFSLNTLLVDDADAAKYSFRYYQVLSAELRLPPNFVAQHLKLTLSSAKSKGAVLESEHVWAELLAQS